MTIEYKDSKRIVANEADVAVVSNRGTIDTTSSSGNTIITFTGNGTFTPTSAFNVQYLVVAGGGGGGAGGAAGGGAGGFKTATGFAVTSQNYDITVGAGGAGGGIDTNENGSKGSDSIFSTITSEGGGYGSGDTSSGDGGDGGSGGGGAKDGGNGNNKGLGTSGQGYNGGNGATTGGYQGSGGGGGSSAVGSDGNANAGGNGGAGTANPISGSTAGVSGYLTGGGGGSGSGGNGSGGSGGGGAGTWTGNVTGVAGTVNTGSGGGGGGEITINNGGGAGGSGIVIIKFATSGNTYSTSAGGKPTNVQDNSILVEKDTGNRFWFDAETVTNSTASSLTDVVFDASTEIGSLTYSGNTITRSVDTYSRSAINANFQFNNTGTQTLELVAQKTGTSAWVHFGLASAKCVDVGATGNASSQFEYAIRSADDERTWIRQSSGNWTQVSDTADNSTYKITNDRTTVTYYANGSSIGTTTHGTPNAKYYPMIIVAQTGVDGSYALDYSGDIITTTPATWTWDFQPTEISSLAHWYDASDLSSIIKDSSNRVSQWNDKKGSDNLTASGSAQPLWTDADQNSKAVIDFVSSRYMSNSASTVAQPNTYFVALTAPDGSGTSTVRPFDSGSQQVFKSGAANRWQLYAGSQPNFTEDIGTAFQIWEITFNGSSSSWKVNNVSKMSDANTGTGSAGALEIAAMSGGNVANNKVGEFIRYDGTLTDAQKTSVYNYLKMKWGL